MKCLFFAIFLLFMVAGCAKRDPNPELRDEIYKDLVTELDIATKSLASEAAHLENLRIEHGKALPQTGQIKFATKKVRDSEDAVNRLNQQKLYFEIKVEQRKHLVNVRYEESLKTGGRPWPDEKELELYKSITKFNRDKIAWEKTKGMKKNVPRGTSNSAK